MDTRPDCPFCLRNNLLKEPIMAETDNGFLIRAHGSDGNFLIIPKAHAESPAELADTWWADFKRLFDGVPADKAHYNLSLNVGQHAGQTVRHLHFWVIPRAAGKPASGKGLAVLIKGLDG